VIIDPTFDIYYEMDGAPLNALELHNAWFANNRNKIKIVLGDNSAEAKRQPFGLIDYYDNFFIRMRNDWLTNRYPRWHPKSNSIMNSLGWSDEYTKKDILVARRTTRKEDLYWELNRTHIEIVSHEKRGENLTLKLYLDTFTPNFNGFVIAPKKENKTIHTIDPVFNWELEPGLNTLEAAAVNKFGIKGRSSIISVNYK
jgi:hypothetical protein